jgi:hypothetical protein
VKAGQTLPDYTFTEESFPCPKGFVWFEEPVHLEDDDFEQAPVRASPSRHKIIAMSWRVCSAGASAWQADRARSPLALVRRGARGP